MEGERQAWDQFLATGKVEDYLSFIKSKNGMKDGNPKMTKEREKEEERNAGFRGSNRDGYI